MSKNDLRLIHQIAERAVDLWEKLEAVEPKDQRFMRIGVIHEVTTVHTEIIPLRLAELLATDDGNFAHDVAGIHQHLEDGAKPVFTDGFTPRFGVYEVAPK